MDQKKPAPVHSKKHVARAERERIQRRWIIGGTIGIMAVVVGVIFYGWASINLSPIAVVNGDKIGVSIFRSRMRLLEAEKVLQADLTTQEGSDQLIAELSDRVGLGQQVLDQLVADVVIRQEAERRGITLSDEELRDAVAESFGFFPNGTPTPLPTFTPNPTLTALASITPTVTEGPSPTPEPTATEGPSPTPAPTRTARPTATPYTREAYETRYADAMTFLQDTYDVSEEDYLAQFEAQIWQSLLFEAFMAEVPREQEHVHARHILLPDERTAKDVLERLEQGADFVELAADFSMDESNKDRGGDLGWFPRGRMVAAFEKAAFGAQVGEVVGPVESSYGFHVIEVLEREVREIDEYTYQLIVQQEFSSFLEQAKADAEVEFASNWTERIPPFPDLQKIFDALMR